MAHTLVLPNSRSEIVGRAAAHRIPRLGSLLMLVARLVLFAGFQALFALVFAVQGSADAWGDSAAWWMLSATLANVVTLAVLRGLLKREGLRLRDLYRVEAHVWWRELLLVLALFVVAGPLSLFPSMILGNALFGDYTVTGAMMFRPLPAWAVIASVLFPLTIVFSELPSYFSYVMPRLEAITRRRWLAVLLPVVFLAAQHMALPLLFDPAFMLWRFGMFVPFALFTGIVLYIRPRLLPYFMVIHGLMDLQLVFMIPVLG